MTDPLQLADSDLMIRSVQILSGLLDASETYLLYSALWAWSSEVVETLGACALLPSVQRGSFLIRRP